MAPEMRALRFIAGLLATILVVVLLGACIRMMWQHHELNIERKRAEIAQETSK